MSAYMEEAIQRFPRDFADGVRDYKAWAKRIVWCEEQGDKSLLSIQVKFAKMALDIKDEVAA